MAEASAVGQGLGGAGRGYERPGAPGRTGRGRLKNEWALAALRVRRLERVRLHVDPTVLAKLSRRLARERGVQLEA